MVFLRFKRLKAALQQGVFLFKDPTDLFTCPLHTLAVAMVMNTTPGRRIFPQFPERTAAPPPSAESTGLLEFLQQLEDGADGGAERQKTKQKQKVAAPEAQAYVNRLLTTVSKLPWVGESGLTSMLTSHSFQRGGAMHANADSNLSSLWVVDRGGWSTSSVSKAFSYMLNTTQEAQKVARQLSGWNPDAGARLPDFSGLDAVVRARVHELQQRLFASTCGFPDRTWNVDGQVLEVLTATLLHHVPDMLEPVRQPVCSSPSAVA